MQSRPQSPYIDFAYKPSAQLMRPVHRADFTTPSGKHRRSLSAPVVRAPLDNKSFFSPDYLNSRLQQSIIRNQPDLVTSTGMTRPNPLSRIAQSCHVNQAYRSSSMGRILSMASQKKPDFMQGPLTHIYQAGRKDVKVETRRPGRTLLKSSDINSIQVMTQSTKIPTKKLVRRQKNRATQL